MSDFIRVGGVQRLQEGEFIVQVSFLFIPSFSFCFRLSAFILGFLYKRELKYFMIACE